MEKHKVLFSKSRIALFIFLEFIFRVSCNMAIKGSTWVKTILILLSLQLTSCKVGRFVYYNFANITDYKIFPSREVENTTQKFFFQNANESKSPKKINIENTEIDFDDYLQQNKTVAFLIIKNDSIQYEKYFDKYDEESIVASFSMAKSVTSMLIGCAIDDGFIKSIDESVTKYIPELEKNGFGKVSIEHLLQMTSGLKYNEGYTNPFGDVATFYYGTNLRKAITKMKLKREPGTKFEYLSGNTQLLGLVLERALEGKTISQYLEEKIWKPLEMEYPASWSTDRKKNGLEKTFCCLNARARDFAKLGRLYLNKGNWNGKQLISKNWVEQSTKIDTTNGSSWLYQYQWWLPSKNGDFMARGMLGQFIYVNPSKNLIIVRLGKDDKKVNWRNLFTSLAEDY